MRRAVLVAVAGMLLGTVFLPAAASAEARARLLSPADGAELTAGSLATIEWEAVELPAGAHEWEAFLSVDGGRTWALRITPHLDLSVRRFTFRVPAFPTRDARLLLRFGDEEREIEVETPQRFTLAAAPFRSAWPALPVRALARGERAREGDRNDPGVVVWVEGSREGGSLREVVAWTPGASVQGVRPAGLLVLPFGVPAEPREDLPPPAVSPGPAPKPLLRSTAEAPKPRTGSVPVRLLIRRFNE